MHKIEVRTYMQGRELERAIYSEERPLESWRRIRGFEENRKLHWKPLPPTNQKEPMKSQLDRLDEIALQVAKGDLSVFRPLSTGERCYVALAANSVAALAYDNNTITEALDRIGDEWMLELIVRWRYRGNPANFEQARTA